MELKYNTQIQSAEINAALNKDREVIRQEGALIQAVANQPPQPMM
jgi:transcriptional regulator of NAD metabolism